jgi:hypothetical protein
MTEIVTDAIVPTVSDIRITPRIQDAEWANFRECIDAPEDMYPRTLRGRKDGRTEEETDLLVDYCGQCSVVEDCLSNALIKGITTGIQGGMTQRERKKLHDSYGGVKKRNPIPIDTWQLAIDNARNLRKEYLDSEELAERVTQATGKILHALQQEPTGIALGADKQTPFHQQFAHKLDLSPVLVRQQLVTLIEGGVIAARTTHNRNNKKVAITAIRLNEAA